MVSWTEPSALWGLGAVLLIAALMAWSGRTRLAGVRGFIGVLLVLALSDPRGSVSVPGTRVVHIVDTSESIPAASQNQQWQALQLRWQQQSADDRIAVVQVDGEARILSPLVPPGEAPTARLPPSAHTGTDLAGGLDLAAQLLPRDTTGRIVLHTDGHADLNPLVPMLAALSDRGIHLEVAPPDIPPGPGDLSALHLPEQGAAGATVVGTVDARGGASGLSGSARVRLRSPSGEEVLLEPLSVDLAAGALDSMPLSLSLPPELSPGLWTVEVGLPTGEPLVAGLTVHVPPSVLLVQGDRRDGAALRGVLEAEGLRVQSVGTRNLPNLDDTIDLVIFAGPPTSGPGALPAAWVASLDAFVDHGGGLLTLAGPRAYAAGGWQDSSLAGLLPVRIDPDGAEKDDSASLLVVLDKSGSMARPAEDAQTTQGMISGVADMMVGGRTAGSKIRVAAEAAAATMTRLRDHDRVGVLAVDTMPYWAVAMTSAEGRADAMDRTRRISAGGGGMYVLTALEAAAEAMKAEKSPLRHILMLIDASDAGEQTRDTFGRTQGALELARTLQEEGITISVVGIGSNRSRDSEFLLDLTRTGGGRLKLTPDIREVSALFAQEVERLVGAAEHEQAPVRLQVDGWHPALKGVDMAAAPPIHGWADVLERPSSRVVLSTPGGTPVFSVWNRGLGQVAAWSSDDGARWALGWPSWSGHAPFWTQLVRNLARSTTREDSPLTVDTSSDTIQVQARWEDAQGTPLPVHGLTIDITVDDAPVPTPPLRLIAPGTVQATLRAPPGARIRATLNERNPTGEDRPRGQAEALVPTPRERSQYGLHEGNLAQLRRPAARVPPPLHTTLVGWPWLLALAALLLPVDAWLRRREPPSRS